MQTLGSPPQEIMGELPPGFVSTANRDKGISKISCFCTFQALGEDGLPAMGPDGCVIA